MPRFDAALLAFALIVLPQAASGQDAQCQRMAAEIRTIDRADVGNPVAAARYQGAIDRQRGEIARTTDYMQSVGCGLSPSDPAQCAALNANVVRMQRNMASLQETYSRLSSAPDPGERRAELAAAMQDAGCDDGSQAPQLRSSDTDTASTPYRQLFGSDDADPGYALPPSAAPEGTPNALDGESATMRTICVRTCDGFFFPISFSTNASHFGQDAQLCHRLCPAAETALYAYDAYAQSPDDALSTETGEPLKSMPNAFRYRTSYDEACSCRAAGESWAQALAPAEQALKDEAGDTQDGGADADDAGVAALPKRGKAKPANQRSAAATPAVVPSTVAGTPDEGHMIETIGPDGKTKRVRAVGPHYAPEP